MQTNEGRLTEQTAPCNICRYKTKHKLRVRSDGSLIQQCARCGLGAIAPIPEDLAVFTTICTTMRLPLVR